jgi:hypothetical protein
MVPTQIRRVGPASPPRRPSPWLQPHRPEGDVRHRGEGSNEIQPMSRLRTSADRADRGPVAAASRPWRGGARNDWSFLNSRLALQFAETPVDVYRLDDLEVALAGDSTGPPPRRGCRPPPTLRINPAGRPRPRRLLSKNAAADADMVCRPFMTQSGRARRKSCVCQFRTFFGQCRQSGHRLAGFAERKFMEHRRSVP